MIEGFGKGSCLGGTVSEGFSKVTYELICRKNWEYSILDKCKRNCKMIDGNKSYVQRTTTTTKLFLSCARLFLSPYLASSYQLSDLSLNLLSSGTSNTLLMQCPFEFCVTVIQLILFSKCLWCQDWADDLYFCLVRIWINVRNQEDGRGSSYHSFAEEVDL